MAFCIVIQFDKQKKGYFRTNIVKKNALQATKYAVKKAATLDSEN